MYCFLLFIQSNRKDSSFFQADSKGFICKKQHLRIHKLIHPAIGERKDAYRQTEGCL